VSDPGQAPLDPEVLQALRPADESTLADYRAWQAE